MEGLHHLLSELLVVFAAALVVAYLLGRIKVPTIVGFMVAGVLLGPAGFGLVEDRHQIEQLAEVGVVLLLFAVGLKLSLKELWQLRVFVLLAGMSQVVLTTLLFTAAALAVGIPRGSAFVCGMIVALSSTAMLMRLVEDRVETDAAHGRFIIGVLLAQDLAVVPILFGLPFFGEGAAAGGMGTLLVAMGKASLVLVVVLVLTYLVFPWLAERAVRARSPELFTLVTAIAVIATALAVSEVGLAMALGAFLAGVVVSSSPYTPQIISEIGPLRDLLNSLFFASIGMLVDPQLWSSRPLALIALVAAIVIGKALIAGGLGLVFLRSARPALMGGAGLAHVGEFSFVVAAEASRLGAISGELFRLLISAAVPSMILAPFAIALASRVRRGAEGPSADPSVAPEGMPKSGHAILIGYGVGGRSVARILRRLDVPFTVVELNPITVRELRDEGVPVLYGDASRETLLTKAGIANARVLVSTVPDPAGTRRLVSLARRMAPALRIIVRTRYIIEVEPLLRLGADEVVPEEVETSIEIAGRVLASFGATDAIIERNKADLRLAVARGESDKEAPLALNALRAMLTREALAELPVEADAPAAGQSLAELSFRRTTGASVLAVLRGRELVTHPPADFMLASGDELFLAGTSDSIEAARRLLCPGPYAREEESA